MHDTTFQQTPLDVALERHPVAEASTRAVLEAARRPHKAAAERDAEPDTGAKPTREGQRETAAASLAAGMIAAEGRPVTAAEAVAKVRDVLDELDRGYD